MTYPLTRFGTLVVAIVTLTLSGTLVYAQSSVDEPEPIVFDEPLVKNQIKDEKTRLEIEAISASTTVSLAQAVSLKASADETGRIVDELKKIEVLLMKINKTLHEK